VTWRRVGAANDRIEWVARSLGATFVDPNRWIRELDFGRETETERENLATSALEFVE
jgi:hypothetical protein